jgi:hypothetical protein
MTHDPLCPDIPCTCQPDVYGHMLDCMMFCVCDIITAAHERGYKEAERIYTNDCMFCGYVGEWSISVCWQCELEE